MKPVKEVKRKSDDNQTNQCWQTEARHRLVTSELIDHERANFVCNILKAIDDFLQVII
jgi:hypothetical protein